MFRKSTSWIGAAGALAIMIVSAPTRSFADAPGTPGVSGAPGAPGVADAAGAPAAFGVADLPRTTTPHPIIGIEAGLGLRINRVASAGFQPFSGGNGLFASSLGAAYRLHRFGLPAVAVGLEWNHGMTTSDARGEQSSLTVDGFSLTLQARVPLRPWWIAYGRVASGAVRVDATLHEDSAVRGTSPASSSASLSQKKWLAAVDAAAGTAMRIFAVSGGPDAPLFGYWLTVEGGYAYCPSYELALSDGAASAPGRADQPLRLGSMSLAGAFMRVGMALTF